MEVKMISDLYKMKYLLMGMVFLLLNLAFAQSNSEISRWNFFPGASREISHSSSASRDTPLLAMQMFPRLVRTAGGDFSVISFSATSITYRLGMQAMLDQESTIDSEFGGFFVKGDNKLWRGMYGFSLAFSFEKMANAWFGKNGALEFSILVRHESEHFTASNDEITEPEFRGVPHIGNFLMLDLAFRIPVGEFESEFRTQHKIFVDEDAPNYAYGPGFDLNLRWKRFGHIQPFTSTFFEYLFGNTFSARDDATANFGNLGGKIPDAYFIRNLTGIVLDGVVGDLWVYTSFEVGHGKGLLVFQEDFRWGGGVRLAFF
jgi:hypothetical protein